VRTAIITFVRTPELGKVKTRIAAAVGPHEALRIYKQLLLHTRHVLTEVKGDTYIYHTGSLAGESSDLWKADVFHKRPQVEGDLGDKLQAAFAECLREYDKVIVIGSDCASLTSSHIDRAISALDDTDAVLGPTLDGGYYLLGLRRSIPSVFENIHWSTATVLDETLAQLAATNATHTLLEKLSDIDYIEDWKQYGWE